MLSRSLSRSGRIHIRWPVLPPNRQHTATQTVRFLHDSSKTAAERSPDQSKQQETHEPRSFRPFAVLLWCIPIGYGINWALKQQNGPGQVSPDGFVKYLLATKEPVSTTCSIFTLVPATPNGVNLQAPELARAITSVQIKQPQLQIARSYTLLPRIEGQDEDELRFLIKKEQKGEVSGYLHRLPLDAELEVRGVSKEYVIPEDVEKVVFLAGGTGIAPALQMANILKDENVQMHVLWANRKREDCAGGVSDNGASVSATAWWSISRLWSREYSQSGQTLVETTPAQAKHQIVRELDQTKAAPGLILQADYFVDDEGLFIKPSKVSSLVQPSSSGRKLLIVSGPEGFVNYWAGPKQWLNGQEVQGPLAGALGAMNTAGWEIVKM